MGEKIIDGVIITPLKKIEVPGGDVLHAMRNDSLGYKGFGEAYFSIVESGKIKAWKQHKLMVLNLVVPYGKVKFVLYDERSGSRTNGLFQEVILSNENYCRLTVPEFIWFGFQGADGEDSLLLNIANIIHDPDEVNRKDISEINFKWKQNS